MHTKPPQHIHVNYSLEDDRFDVLSRQEATTTGIQQRELDERVKTGYYRTKNINYKQRGKIVLRIFLSSYYLTGKELIEHVKNLQRGTRWLLCSLLTVLRTALIFANCKRDPLRKGTPKLFVKRYYRSSAVQRIFFLHVPITVK